MDGVDDLGHLEVYGASGAELFRESHGHPSAVTRWRLLLQWQPEFKVHYKEKQASTDQQNLEHQLHRTPRVRW